MWFHMRKKCMFKYVEVSNNLYPGMQPSFFCFDLPRKAHVSDFLTVFHDLGLGISIELTIYSNIFAPVRSPKWAIKSNHWLHNLQRVKNCMFYQGLLKPRTPMNQPWTNRIDNGHDSWLWFIGPRPTFQPRFVKSRIRGQPTDECGRFW